MYTVHIHTLSPTLALKDKVPYHAWTKRKPDVSHLRIFGSIAYANIPKKLRGRKLGVTSVKCQMLGWWADGTKGYQLEDVETQKLITSRDVVFVEDDQPMDMAIIEGNGLPDVLPELTSPDLEASKAPSEPTAASRRPSVPIEHPTEVEQPRDASENDPALTSTSKPSKWATLPSREPSLHTRKEPERYGIQASETEVAEAESHRVEHHALVTYDGPATY